jgi:hypothetical protein
MLRLALISPDVQKIALNRIARIKKKIAKIKFVSGMQKIGRKHIEKYRARRYSSAPLMSLYFL